MNHDQSVPAGRVKTVLLVAFVFSVALVLTNLRAQARFIAPSSPVWPDPVDLISPVHSHAVSLKSDSVLYPREIVDEYVRAHSVQSLRQSTKGRKYALAYYSCPLQAGNRLHHFFNGFLWAIVTNRTLLWKYYDRESCQQLGSKYDPKICEAANHVEDCDAVLSRRDWMPSYEEWLPSGVQPTELPFWTTHPREAAKATMKDVAAGNFTSFHIVGARKYPWKPQFEQSTRVDLVDDPVVVFPIMIAKYDDLQWENHRDSLLGSQEARNRAEALYSHGADYLYGLLFRESFEFQVQAPPQVIDPTSFSVAIHSRHKRDNDNGSNIQSEIRCLESVLRAKGDQQRCQVVVLSDRIATIRRLKRWLTDRGCEALTADHDEGTSFKTEHGPFAGAGFFQDLALASQVRDGFVGGDRSSSDLVVELIAHDRATDLPPRGPLVTCQL